MNDLKLDQKVLRIVGNPMAEIRLIPEIIYDVIDGVVITVNGNKISSRSKIITNVKELKKHIYDNLLVSKQYTVSFDEHNAINVHLHHLCKTTNSLREGIIRYYDSPSAQSYAIKGDGKSPFKSIDTIYNEIINKTIAKELLSNIEYEVKC